MRRRYLDVLVVAVSLGVWATESRAAGSATVATTPATATTPNLGEAGLLEVVVVPSGASSVEPGRDSDSQATGLLARVRKRAKAVAHEINKSGGYRFDGRNDCYGFIRRLWDPILSKLRKPDLPVDTYVDKRWKKITDWNKLVFGDVLATARGHHWGGNWHGGLYGGKKGGKQLIFDNSSSRHGAYLRAGGPGLFFYYYEPTHKLLKEAQAGAQTGDQP